MKPWNIALILIVIVSQDAFALAPEEVLVLANKRSAKSLEIARYYMEKRHIPENNLVLLEISTDEICTFEEYQNRAAAPVQTLLLKSGFNTIRCIVTVYKIPLKIKNSGPTEEEHRRIIRMEREIQKLKMRLDKNKNKTEAGILKHHEQAGKRLHLYKRSLDRAASFDSELSLVKKHPYDLKSGVPNPYFLGFRTQKLETEKSEVLMVSRLDGPDPETVKRIIDDSLEAEQQGVSGRAYFDARWGRTEGRTSVSDYRLYDESIHRTVDYLKKNDTIAVQVDQTELLFQQGQCPDAALYCGWYSPARYVDAFTWQKGAVGYHMASLECMTLRDRGSNVWCKRMLEEGIAATAGPVGEPYIRAFPVPEIFFRFLVDGHLTLAECYLVSLPYLSWKMVLLGDPLYRLNIR